MNWLNSMEKTKESVNLKIEHQKLPNMKKRENSIKKLTESTELVDL